MRTIPLSADEQGFLTTLISHPVEGMDLNDIRLALKVLDRLDSKGETVTFEEPEYSLLLKRYKAAKFVKVDRLIVDLYDKLTATAAA